MIRRPLRRMHRRHGSHVRRTAALTAVLLGVWLVVAPVAEASAFGEARGRSVVTSAFFGAVITPTSVNSVPSCPSSQYCKTYTFTLTSGPGATPVLFDVWNTGSVALTGLSYQATWGPGTIDLTACSVAWTAGGPGPGGGQPACSGTKTAVATNATSGSYTAAGASGTFPRASGAEIFLEVTAGKPAPPPNAVVAVSLSVCSGGPNCSDGTTSRQIAAVTTTNA